MEKIAKITLHQDKTAKVWYSTEKDSQISFSTGYHEVSNAFNLYNDRTFTGGKYFQMGKNGGSYALNFNKKDLNSILKILKKEGFTVIYYMRVNNSIIDKIISKNDYMKQQATDNLDVNTVKLAKLIQ